MATANLLQTSVSGGTQNALSLQGDGVFFPKASTTSRLALTLTTTDKGFIVYDTTDNNIYFWNGTAWESIPGSGDAGANGSVQYNDNGIVSGATNFVYNKATSAVSITGDLTVDTNVLAVNALTNTVGIGATTTDAKFRILDGSGNGVRIGFSPGVLNYNLYDATVHEFRAAGGTNSFGAITANGIGLGVTPSASGVGVTFPAVQVASSDANCLDDYEEGTFTPTIVGNTIAGVGVYVNQVGTYTKIGNQVTVWANIEWSSHTGTGTQMYIGGLPFNIRVLAGYSGSATIGYINNIALTAGNFPLIVAGSSDNFARFFQSPTGGGAATAVPMDTAGQVIFSMTYNV